MEFFGITLYGPQNYIKDMMRDEYREPEFKEEVAPLMQKILSISTCPEKIKRPDFSIIRLIDCYIGRVNGFAYGSSQRFKKMKRKGVIKPAGPSDIYRLPATTSLEYQQVRNKWANWMMIRDVKRRRMNAEHFLERTRINALRKNDVLPIEIREMADKEINKFELNACPLRINNRCVITSRPRGIVKEWRMSRIVWRHLADYNKLSGVQRAMWG